MSRLKKWGDGMGGFGSGVRGGKPVTSDKLALDIRKIQRAGRLAPGQSFQWQWSRDGKPIATIIMRSNVDSATLNYRTRDPGGTWQTMDYPVRISWTSCHYGGQRAWWHCPAAGCGRRVAVLYGGKVFACRHCHKLAYPTQREPAHERALSRADKLRDRLGWDAGVANGCGDRPKGMHWKTFERLVGLHDLLVRETVAGVTRRLARCIGLEKIEKV